jgi:8-oxo-dGTP pyrophosphatase MutT (NUDIX family)
VLFRDAVERLASLPPELPAPPTILMPIRLDTGEPGRAPSGGSGDAGRPAGVLVLVTPGQGDASDSDAEVVLMERVDRGGHHSGEISFPGGKAEAGETAEETALREAAEEVGLDADAAGVRVIGRLETFWIPVSNFRVQPILAIAAKRPELTPSPDEVASIIRAPLAAFRPGARIEVVEREIRGWHLRYGAYPIAGHLVWGATARVLGQLGALVA